MNNNLEKNTEENMICSIDNFFDKKKVIGMKEDSVSQLAEKYNFTKKLTGKMPVIDKYGKAVINDGKFIFENGTYISYIYTCDAGYGNLNILNFEFHVNEYGIVDNFEKYIYFDDNNFSERKINITQNMFGDKESFRRTLSGIVRNNIKNGYDLKSLLKENNFLVSEIENYYKGGYIFHVNFPPDRENIFFKINFFKYMNMSGANNLTKIYMDTNKRITHIDKIKTEN